MNTNLKVKMQRPLLKLRKSRIRIGRHNYQS